MRLTDVDKLREDYGLAEYCNDCQRDSWKCGDDYSHSIRDFCGWLDSAEVMDVVQCKDCKYWHRDDPTGNGCECSCNGGWWLPEDYCSCGERRGNDE